MTREGSLNKREAGKILEKCFSALPEADMDRLEYHMEKDTTILCGTDAGRWIDEKGGG